jgi:hypothetical protein
MGQYTYRCGHTESVDIVDHRAIIQGVCLWCSWDKSGILQHTLALPILQEQDVVVVHACGELVVNPTNNVLSGLCAECKNIGARCHKCYTPEDGLHRCMWCSLYMCTDCARNTDHICSACNAHL